MAQAIKGANITLLDSTPFQKPKATAAHGRLRVFEDTLDITALVAAGTITTKLDSNGGATVAAMDTVTLARLPAGSMVHDGEIVLGGTITATGCVGAIGDSDDTNRFTTPMDLTTATMLIRSNIGAGGAVKVGFSDCGKFNVFVPPASPTNFGNPRGKGYTYTCQKDILLTISSGFISAGQLYFRIVYSID